MGTIARVTKAGGGTNFNSGQTIDPAEVNNDFNAVYTEINGLLDDGNIETATIPGAKSLRFTEIASPSNPSANDLLLFAKDNSGTTRLRTLDSAGLETLIGTWGWEAGNAAEATTTSTSNVIVRALTVSIAATDAFLVLASLRKSAGAAASASIGLDVNGTQIFTSQVWSGATNQQEIGLVAFLLSASNPGTTSRAGGMFTFLGGGPTTTNYRGNDTNAASVPTTINITGLVGSASITLGVSRAVVYRWYGL
jgi:hypothetical protein